MAKITENPKVSADVKVLNDAFRDSFKDLTIDRSALSDFAPNTTLASGLPGSRLRFGGTEPKRISDELANRSEPNQEGALSTLTHRLGAARLRNQHGEVKFEMGYNYGARSIEAEIPLKKDDSVERVMVLGRTGNTHLPEMLGARYSHLLADGPALKN